MSGSNITARDRVWAALFEQQGQFRVAAVRETIETDNRPSDETIHRVLRSATELDIVKHRSGSPYYRLAHRTDKGNVRPAKGGETVAFDLLLSILEEHDRRVISDPEVMEERREVRRIRKVEFVRRLLNYLAEGDQSFLDPNGIDVDEFIEQFLDERTEDVIYNESDDIEDIISDERAMTLAQSGHPEGHHILGNPSSHGRQRWKSAFLTQFGEADHIVIVDTSSDDVVDLAEHLDMDRFEQGTYCLDLGDLRETPLFDDILTELFRSHRPALDYREIEDHVRTKVGTVKTEPSSPEWDEDVESLVDEVVEVFEPTDPREQSRIAEWVRSIAREETND